MALTIPGSECEASTLSRELRRMFTLAPDIEQLYSMHDMLCYAIIHKLDFI